MQNIRYAPDGYIEGRPLASPDWRSLCPGEPEGLVRAQGTVPPGFLIVQGFLTPSECNQIVGDCARAVAHDAQVTDPAGGVKAVQSSFRTSQYIDPYTLSVDVESIVRRAYLEIVAPHFGASIDWFERPEILKYGTGGEYKPHADAENWNATSQRWERVIDRDISMLLYLNGGVQGGEIQFPNFGLSLPMQPGLLVAFPSDHRYLHAARPVVSGTKYAIVSWAAIKGSARVEAQPRSTAIPI